MPNLVSTSISVGTSECMDQPGSTTHEGEPKFFGTQDEGKALSQGNLTQQKTWVADLNLKCTMCKQLLFHPIVLNCGHGNQYIYLSLISAISLQNYHC